MNGDDFHTRAVAALERIAAALELQNRRNEPVRIEPVVIDTGDRTFDQPLMVKRYVTGEAQPTAEGDWQLHNDGHEGEETE